MLGKRTRTRREEEEEDNEEEDERRTQDVSKKVHPMCVTTMDNRDDEFGCMSKGTRVM